MDSDSRGRPERTTRSHGRLRSIRTNKLPWPYGFGLAARIGEFPNERGPPNLPQSPAPLRKRQKKSSPAAKLLSQKEPSIWSSTLIPTHGKYLHTFDFPRSKPHKES